MSLSPPSGFSQPIRRQNSFDRAWRLGGGEAAISAQERHLFGGEVAPVVPALDVNRHPGAVSARLRSSLIDQGSHGDGSSGGRPSFLAQA